MLKEDFIDTRIIAIIRGISGSGLDKLANALYNGGIKMAEITLNSPEALSSIAELKESFQGKMHIGAGTVTNLNDAKEAVRAGAEFIVTPNIDEDVIRYCVSQDILITPGALTPTEVQEALSYGSEFVKIFPIGSMGAKYIKDMLAPFDRAKFVAVGGVNTENCREYIENGAYGVGVGGNLCRIPEDGDFAKVTDYARALIAACNR